MKIIQGAVPAANTELEPVAASDLAPGRGGAEDRTDAAPLRSASPPPGRRAPHIDNPFAESAFASPFAAARAPEAWRPPARPTLKGDETTDALVGIMGRDPLIGVDAARALLQRADATAAQRAHAHAIVILESTVPSLDAALSAAVNRDQPHVLAAVLEHFGDVRTWSKAASFMGQVYDGSEGRTVALLVRHGLQPVDQVSTFAGFAAPLHPCAAAHLQGVAPHQLWRLVINGDMHAVGYGCFDRREPGYLDGMMVGLQRMLETVDAPPTADLLNVLHHAAVHGVSDGTRDGGFVTGFRATGSSFGLLPGQTMSLQGMIELQDKLATGILHGWSNLAGQGRMPALSSSVKTPAEVRTKVDVLFGRYHAEIAAADTEDAKLTAIVRCVQDLEQVHPFTDGNIRTMVFLLGNKLLMQNGMPPAIYADPNVFDAFSEKELVAIVKQGQDRFRAI